MKRGNCSIVGQMPTMKRCSVGSGSFASRISENSSWSTTRRLCGVVSWTTRCSQTG